MTTLVCFAVRDEARFFRPPPGCQSLVTGMGSGAARTAIEPAFRDNLPSLVVTCGFAGGLSPDLASGTLLFETDHPRSSAWLRGQGVREARFHCASRVAVTRAEKQALRDQTGADAVEMESGVIQAMCRERAVPCVTLRVISDTAAEELPVDFNPLITPEGALRLGGLIGHVLAHPGCIPGLLRLQRQTRHAAGVLGACLESFLARKEGKP